MGKLNQINYAGTAFTNESELVELTQAEYNALTDVEKNNGKVYFITDVSANAPRTLVIDSELSSSSENPIQNKAVNAALESLESRIAALEALV